MEQSWRGDTLEYHRNERELHTACDHDRGESNRDLDRDPGRYKHHGHHNHCDLRRTQPWSVQTSDRNCARSTETTLPLKIISSREKSFGVLDEIVFIGHSRTPSSTQISSLEKTRVGRCSRAFVFSSKNMYKKKKRPFAYAFPIEVFYSNRMKHTVFLGLIAPCLLASCASTSNPTCGFDPCKLNLTLSAPNVSVKQNASSPVAVTVSTPNGYVGSVDLSLRGLPNGVRAVFTPDTVNLSSGATSTGSTFTLSASTDAVVDKPFSITVYAIGTNTAKAATVQVTVTTAPPPAPAALTVGPKPVTLAAGGAMQVFTAALQNSSETITWSLVPAGQGSLSITTGASVTYTSPASTTTLSATLKASVPSGASDTVPITISGSGTPPPPPPVTLTVSPKPATLNAGGATQVFTATLLNSSEPITWSLGSATGTLSSTTGASVTYTPPASQTLLITTLTASVPSGASDTVQITINGSGPPPAPTITIDPNVVSLDAGGATQAFTATLLNSSETITWSLSSAVGSLSNTTGTTTTYTSPSTTINKTVTLKASVPSGANASVRISIIGSGTCAPVVSTTQIQQPPPCP